MGDSGCSSPWRPQDVCSEAKDAHRTFATLQREFLPELRWVAPVGPQAARSGYRLNEMTSTLHIVQHGWCQHVKKYISSIISQNEGTPAAFSSSVRSFWIPVPNPQELSISKNLWGECAYHAVRHHQAAIVLSVFPIVGLTTTWCHEGPQIHWLDHSSHAGFHAMDVSNPCLQEDRQHYEATSEIGRQIWSGLSYTLFGVPQQNHMPGDCPVKQSKSQRFLRSKKERGKKKKQSLVRPQRRNIAAFS